MTRDLLLTDGFPSQSIDNAESVLMAWVRYINRFVINQILACMLSKLPLTERHPISSAKEASNVRSTLTGRLLGRPLFLLLFWSDGTAYMHWGICVKDSSDLCAELANVPWGYRCGNTNRLKTKKYPELLINVCDGISTVNMMVADGLVIVGHQIVSNHQVQIAQPVEWPIYVSINYCFS